MRTYRLTQKGKSIARSPTRTRNPLLDYLNQPETKVSTFDELVLAIGKIQLKSLLSDAKSKGYVEEVQNGGGGYV